VSYYWEADTLLCDSGWHGAKRASLAVFGQVNIGKGTGMKTGDVEWIPISDGTVWWDGGGAFGLVPRARWEKLLPPDAQNRVPLALRCLLIRAPNVTLLVDTGMGDKVTPDMAERQNFTVERPDGWLVDDLARHGVEPSDVDIVVLTHLHADHCGGSTRIVDGRLVPTFPRAQYWVQRREWQEAHRPNERTRSTYLGENFDPLQQTGQLCLLDGDAPVTRGVRVAVAPGHTAAMQAVVIESGGETAAFISDLAFFRWHLERLAWVSAYDIDPMTTIDTKRRWQPWLAERQATVILQHDPQMIAGTLREDKGRYTLVGSAVHP
jgi:glyoxylase-like metal-dependent hydrolase (beta-lactamase superfamily II)